MKVSFYHSLLLACDRQPKSGAIPLRISSIPFLTNEGHGGEVEHRILSRAKKLHTSSKTFMFAPAGHTAGGQVLGCCSLLPSWFHSWTWSLKQISVTYSVSFHNIQVGDNIPAYFHICTSEITGRKGGTGGGGNLVGYNHSLTQGKCLCTSPRIHSRKT